MPSATEQPGSGAVFGTVVVVGIVVAGIIFAIASSDSGSEVSSVFEDRYEVFMPDGEIKTMSESELEKYNKE